MASIPDREELPLHQEGVAPGWTYDEASKKYSPVNTNLIKVNRCDPNFKFIVWKHELLEKLTVESRVFERSVWFQEYSAMKGGYVILLKGTKTVMDEGFDIVAHEKCVVKSLNFKYYADMLLKFSCPIDDDVISDLENHLSAVVRKRTHSLIPPVIQNAFLLAVLCPKGEDSKKMTSIKHSLHEFCRLIMESAVSKFPATATILKPVPNKPIGFTYASAVKNSTIGQKGKTGQSHQTSYAFEKNLSMDKTIKPRNNKTNPEVIMGEKSSKSGVFHPPPEKVRMQVSSNTLSANELDLEQNVQHLKNELRKGTPHSSTTELQMFHEKDSESCRKKRLAEAQKSQSTSNPPEDLVCKSQIKAEAKISYAPKERKCTNSLVMDKIDGLNKKSEPSNGTFRNQYALRSRTTNSVTTSGAHVHHKNVPNSVLNDHNSVDPAVDYDGQVDHEKETRSKSSNRPLTSEAYYSRNISMCRSVENVSSQLKDHTQRWEKLPSVCNDELVLEEYGETGIRHVTMDHPVQTSKKPQAYDDQSELEAEKDLGKVGCFKPNHPPNCSSKKRDKAYVQVTKYVDGTIPLENETERSFNGLHKIDGTKIVATKVPADTQISETKLQEHHKQNTYDCEGNLDQSSLYLKPFKEFHDSCGMRRKYFGISSNIKEKTIILVGASGSGKTTLVNFVANYFKGVKTADGQLVHVEVNTNDVRSHTTSISAYTFCFSSDDTPITVVDTPGLNDTSGAEVRDHVLSLKTFLANAVSQNFQIHAICFVAQAHLVRLTSSERLVMDYVSTLFGLDIVEHFITFITFADNQESPPVVEAIRNYGINCKNFFKFNNSAVSNSKTDEIDDLDRVYWRIGSKSWKKFLNYLMTLPAFSVQTLQALQSEVFATTVIENAERHLKAELTAFINFCKQSKYSTKEANCTGEKVWELAAAVHSLTPVQLSCPMDVKTILVKFAEAVCKENGFSSSKCIKRLSLVPSRNLLSAGIGLIQSVAPVYKFVMESSNKKRRTTTKNFPEVLYCHQCDKNHELEKVKPSMIRNVLSLLGLGSSAITYKCLECKCDGNLHGPEEDDNPVELLDSYKLHSNKLLNHTRNCITTILEDMSIPGYRIDGDHYLDCINHATGNKFEVFIEDLLKRILT